MTQSLTFTLISEDPSYLSVLQYQYFFFLHTLIKSPYIICQWPLGQMTLLILISKMVGGLKFREACVLPTNWKKNSNLELTIKRDR